jgi:hypothetical protein
MNQLDDFEKQLRDQLKGHVAPEPLMWSRLTDALSSVKPWYAKSIFKYSLTALTSLTIGAYASYFYFEQKGSAKAQINIAQDRTKQQQLSSTQVPKRNNERMAALDEQSTPQISTSAFTSTKRTHLEDAPPFFAQQLTEQFTEQKAIDAESVWLPIGKHVATKIPISKTALLQKRSLTSHTGRIGLSIASGTTQSSLPIPTYQIGPLAEHQLSQSSKSSPLLQLQIALFTNWHFNIGVQQISQQYTEHFQKTEVFSYDDKEHYLFPYIYGVRKLSDEELHGGPWPFGPNPPGGPSTSFVLANYTSQIQTNTLYVPLTLSYHKQFGLFEAQLHAGVGLQFGYNNTHTLELPGYLPSTILLDEPFLRFNTSLQSQLRLSYLANKHLAVFVEPQFRLAFSKQDFEAVSAFRAQSKGAYAGLSWKF